MPPPESFASELLGLLSHSALHDNKTPMNAKVKHSYMVTQEKMACPLDHNPKYLNFWSKNPRDRVFGAIPNAFSSDMIAY